MTAISRLTRTLLIQTKLDKRCHTWVIQSLRSRPTWLTLLIVGLALSQQMLPPEEDIPVDENDWIVDEVVTADT